MQIQITSYLDLKLTIFQLSEGNGAQINVKRSHFVLLRELGEVMWDRKEEVKVGVATA